MARIPTPTKTRRAAPTTEAPTQGEREQARERQTLERGEAMAPETRLDRDLAHLGAPDAGRRAQPRRRREPDHVPMIYTGKKSRSILTDQYISVIVPTEENDAKVADLEEVIPGLDRESQQRAWQSENARLGVERIFVPLADRLIVSGNDYQFELGKSALVHEDDVAYLLAHDTYRIERASDVEVDDAPPMRRRPGYRGS